VAFFDKRSVGAITSQLQDDAARIHSFSGEPIRTVISALGSVAIGVVISLFVSVSEVFHSNVTCLFLNSLTRFSLEQYMWPLSLVTIACIPIMGFATNIRMKQMLGTDEDVKKVDSPDQLGSPAGRFAPPLQGLISSLCRHLLKRFVLLAGVVVETLLNMRTVAALVLEERRFQSYEDALRNAEPKYQRTAFIGGTTAGLALFIQQWVNALQMWFGGWLMINKGFTFNDFLIANFSILFSLFGLGSAFTGVSDRAEVEKSAGRIFYLLDKKSEIDPLSSEGKKLD
jgi:ATP-binding cassette subfamily B (MDR/TAP) protein 1